MIVMRVIWLQNINLDENNPSEVWKMVFGAMIMTGDAEGATTGEVFGAMV